MGNAFERKNTSTYVPIMERQIKTKKGHHFTSY